MTIRIHLDFKALPAFALLVKCTEEIALTHGVEFAADWIGDILEREASLFLRCTTSKQPPLEIIQGGAQ